MCGVTEKQGGILEHHDSLLFTGRLKLVNQHHSSCHQKITSLHVACFSEMKATGDSHFELQSSFFVNTLTSSTALVS